MVAFSFATTLLSGKDRWQGMALNCVRLHQRLKIFPQNPASTQGGLVS
jgi:hypothetical protein